MDKKFQIPKTLGLTLKPWRESYNLTQDEVAETWNLTQPAISKMEKADEKGERTFFIIEEPEGYWRCMEVTERHAGKFSWL